MFSYLQQTTKRQSSRRCRYCMESVKKEVVVALPFPFRLHVLGAIKPVNVKES